MSSRSPLGTHREVIAGKFVVGIVECEIVCNFSHRADVEILNRAPSEHPHKVSVNSFWQRL
uniref:Uncharacterized protein n=1 Tax=Physcomitrium patens TaxID=3218 RepID=A0A2K1JD73_PHYPA|nr:hypothetical protein PHYPA_019758 [Physcomitrium patens]